MRNCSEDGRHSNLNLISILCLALVLAGVICTDVIAADKYVWVTNTAEGTISKVDLSNGKETARYFTGPPKSEYPLPHTLDWNYYETVGVSRGLEPSRTAFDNNGNVWVLNIAFPQPGRAQLDPNDQDQYGVPSVTCIRTNTAGLTQTSGDWSGDGQIQYNEMYSWGQDQAVPTNRHYSIPAANGGGRGLTFDKSGYLWVGINNPGRVYCMDTTNGSILDIISVHPVYGMTTAPSGKIYVLSKEDRCIQEVDPGSHSVGGTGSARVTRTRTFDPGYSPYSITVDKNCVIWVNTYKENSDMRLYRWDPRTDDLKHGDALYTFSGPDVYNRGSITVDCDGNVYVPNSVLGTVSKFAGTNPPTWQTNFNLPAPFNTSDPIGIDITNANNLVLTFKNATQVVDGKWLQISRSGAYISSGTLPMRQPGLIGNGIYSRGDLTGHARDIRETPSPLATCPTDKSFFQCSLTPITLSGFGNITVGCQAGTIANTVSVSGGTLVSFNAASGTVVFNPRAGSNVLTHTVTDGCGRTSTCQTTVTVNVNHAPALSVPSNQTIFQCSPTLVGLPYSASDADGNLSGTSIVSGPGYLSGGKWYYTPTGSQTVTVTLRTTDDCGLYSQKSFTITFTINTLPTLAVPSTQTFFQCTPTEVRLAYSSYDPDGNSSAVTIYSGPGYLSGGKWCYTPAGDETVNVTLRVTDPCGVVNKSFAITFDLNAAPVLVGPSNDSVFQCQATEICRSYSASDEDGNLAEVIILSGPGYLTGGASSGNWCYTPTANDTVNVTLRALDQCGAFSDQSFRIVFDINAAPYLEAPADDSIFQCVPTEVCLPFIASDEDGNLQGTEIVIGPGELIGDTWCFTPPKDTVVFVTLRALDTCGYTTDDSFRLVFDINSPPVLEVPPRDSFFQCRPEEVCLPYSATDEDGNLTSVVIASGPGQLRDGNWCFTPEHDGVVSVTIRATDSCGESVEKTFEQEFDLNQFPEVSCPPDDTLHWGQLYTGRAAATDSDLVTYHAENLTYSLGSVSPDGAGVDPETGLITWQTAGADVCDHTFEVIVTDVCGDADTCYFNVCVQNTRPVISCPPDTLRFTYGDTVFGAVTAIDPDNGPKPLTFLVNSFSGPGEITLNPSTGEFYWPTDTTADYTCTFELSVIVTDSANLCSPCSPENADTCTVVIKVLSEGIVIEKVHNQIQGLFSDVDIDILPGRFCNYPFGGCELLIAYDNSALTLAGVQPGQFINDCEWEYFTYRYGPFGNCSSGCPSGLVRISIIAETNNGPSHPVCFVDGPSISNQLAVLRFLISNDRTLECQYVPIRFFWMDCTDNTLSSIQGDTLMISRDVYDYLGGSGSDSYVLATDTLAGFPTYEGAPNECIGPVQEGKSQVCRLVDFYNGGIDIVCANTIDDRGDLNLDGLAYTIADAVVFANYFVYGLTVFSHASPTSVDAAIAASDVNGDGLTLSVADLVYLIRIIIGDAEPYAESFQTKLDPIEAGCSVESDGTVSADVELGAVHLVVEGRCQPQLLVPDLSMKFDFVDGNTRIIIYSMDHHGFSGPFVRVSGEISFMEMATKDGHPVSVGLIPSEFELSQNWPNPFNPVTSIRFGLPVPSEYSLAIYNVVGRKAAEFSGSAGAGYHTVEWDASKCASGVYFYRLQAGEFVSTKKMVLLK